MSKGNFSERIHVVPVLPSQDLGNTVTQTTPFQAREHWIEVNLPFGVITGNATVKVYGCTSAAKAGATAVATWWYRKTAATGSDSIGAITAGSAAGITMTASTDNNKTLVIDLDPDQFNENGYSYAYVEVTPGTVCLVSAIALFFPRFPMNVQISEVA